MTLMQAIVSCLSEEAKKYIRGMRNWWCLKDTLSMSMLSMLRPIRLNCPFGVTEKVLNIDLAGEELWMVSELQIPVYHTEDGMFF